MNIKNRIKHLEQKLKPVELNFSELPDAELLAFTGDDYKWLFQLTDQELEEIINNEH